ncbi:hypothetical protein PRK78_000495 [Emydomyces testavorans]|uniref:Uncharacterized protein n=1 Tax=Emydomyces testavorans TaxID=2070801 RepID=A0AAF0DAT6_9EURO|nr:hypothetical protein PRK78_000495 [Emydomyces testavorans]
MCRAERCLWLGHQLASLDVWIAFDEQQKMFVLKEFGLELERHAEHGHLSDEAAQFFGDRCYAAVEQEQDIKMTDALPMQAAEQNPEGI